VANIRYFLAPVKSRFTSALPAVALASLLAISSASAVTSFTETFNTNASGWINGANGAVTYNSNGGVGNSGYISYTSTFTSGASGSFGAPPLALLLRGNNGAASGSAFAGDWVASGVTSLTVSVMHNYTSDLTLYARLDAGSGRAASLASDGAYTVAPNTWTTITIPIIDSNPPFLSYGAGTFSTVFSNIQNVQLGFYVPANTTFTNFTISADNISLNAVPEPASLGLAAAGALGFLARRRRSAR